MRAGWFLEYMHRPNEEKSNHISAEVLRLTCNEVDSIDIESTGWCFVDALGIARVFRLIANTNEPWRTKLDVGRPERSL